MSEWLPIDSAPAGMMVRLLGYRETARNRAESVMGDGVWSEDGWDTTIPAGSIITHWRPTPGGEQA